MSFFPLLCNGDVLTEVWIPPPLACHMYHLAAPFSTTSVNDIGTYLPFPVPHPHTERHHRSSTASSAHLRTPPLTKIAAGA
jgi:hypothetical protein